MQDWLDADTGGTRFLGRDPELGGLALETRDHADLAYALGQNGNYDDPLIVWGDRHAGARNATSVRVHGGNLDIEVPDRQRQGEPVAVDYPDSTGRVITSDNGPDPDLISLEN